MKKMLLVGILHGLLCPLALMAQTVTITFTGVAIDNPDVGGTDAMNGYSILQPVSFNFVINDNAPSGVLTNFGNTYSWSESYSSTSVYSAVSGTGITGTFVKPNNDFYIYNSWVEPTEPDDLFVRMQYTGGATTGLSANSSNIYSMNFNLTDLTALDWGDFSGDVPSVSSFLSVFAGTYGATPYAAYISTDTNTTYFTISTVTISSTAVPEPSTYAAFVGLLALGFVAVRRRRRG
jgi:hypothetical protein